MEALTKPVVMIIDDDPLIRDVLVRIIGKFDCDTIQAGGGQEALELLVDPAWSDKIGMVLTDIMMPYMSGIELLKAIHELKPELLVAIITGAATLDNSIEALNAGAYAYLIKPINPHQVEDVITHGLEVARETQARAAVETNFLERYEALENQLVLLQQSRPSEGELFEDLIRGLRHELGNTATAIKLNLSVMEQKGSSSTTGLQEHLKDLEDSTDQLVALIGRLKQYPKQHSAQESTNLREVLKDLAVSYRDRLTENGVSLKLDLPDSDVMVAGTNVELARVCSHILDNAIEATAQAAGGQITIALEYDDTMATVTFQDEGPGFPPTTVEELFSPSFTTKITEGVVRGLGLGLFIARATINLYGGRISLRNRASGGANVYIQLPLVHFQSDFQTPRASARIS